MNKLILLCCLLRFLHVQAPACDVVYFVWRASVLDVAHEVEKNSGQFRDPLGAYMQFDVSCPAACLIAIKIMQCRSLLAKLCGKYCYTGKLHKSLLILLLPQPVQSAVTCSLHTDTVVSSDADICLS